MNTRIYAAPAVKCFDATNTMVISTTGQLSCDYVVARPDMKTTIVQCCAQIIATAWGREGLFSHNSISCLQRA